MARRALTIVAATALLASCTVGPEWKRPETTPNANWRQPAPEGPSFGETAWPDVYTDPDLRQLIRLAHEKNQDVLIAAKRVEEAAARLGFTKADMWPSFTYQASAGRTDPGSTGPALSGSPYNDFFVGAGVSWEIDLWGKFRRANESARAALLASEESRRAVALTVVADVASLYYRLRDLDEELAISKRTLKSRTESTALIRKRFEGGITSELDVHQAEIEEADTAAAIPAIERQIAQTEDALNVLLGRMPGDVARSGPLSDEGLPDEVPAGLPSELLERRPDVLAAEGVAHAALAQVGVAQALRFPSLSLTAVLGVESQELSDLLKSDSGTWSGVGGLLGPIFEFGKNKRRVEIYRAQAEQAALAWEKTALNAFREVEDALAVLRTSRVEHDARVRQVKAADAAAKLSRARYDGGVTSYLEVLDVERSQYQSQLASVRSLAQAHLAVVQLYKALGGGWSGPSASEAAPAKR